MRFDVLTLFPEMVTGPLSVSIVGRAQASGCISLAVHDIRVHGVGKHRTVDDTPYGGGSGMVMRCDVVAESLRAVRGDRERVPIVVFEPSGARFDQRMAERFAAAPEVILVCGHYEGIDARFAEAFAPDVEVISIGDFVLTGGEYAALVFIDAVARLLPGVLGNADSTRIESFAPGRGLEFPQYTRPRVWEDLAVPEILFSGHHAKIDAWRDERSAAKTQAVRPDLALLSPRPDPPRTPRGPRPAEPSAPGASSHPPSAPPGHLPPARGGQK